MSFLGSATWFKAVLAKMVRKRAKGRIAPFQLTKRPSTEVCSGCQSKSDMSELFADRQAQRSTLHTRHLNEQMVRVLKTIGYDVGFQRGRASISTIARTRAISTS